MASKDSNSPFLQPIRDIVNHLLLVAGALGVSLLAHASQRLQPSSVWLDATIEVVEFGGLVIAVLVMVGLAIRALRFPLGETRQVIHAMLPTKRSRKNRRSVPTKPNAPKRRSPPVA